MHFSILKIGQTSPIYLMEWLSSSKYNNINSFPPNKNQNIFHPSKIFSFLSRPYPNSNHEKLPIVKNSDHIEHECSNLKHEPGQSQPY